MTVVVILEAVLLAVLTVLVAGLLRAYANVLRRLHKLDGGEGGASAPAPFQVAPGLPAPATVEGRDEWAEAHDITGATPDGEIVALRTVGTEYDTVLLFLSSGCTSCATFWAELAGPAGPLLPGNTRLVVLTRGPEHESPEEIAHLAPPGVELLLSTQAWTDFEVPGSPYVVLVDGATGRVRGEGTGQSWTQVAELLARSSGDAGFLTGGPDAAKPFGDAAREADVDRELLAAGILPGDPRLYDAEPDGTR